MRFLNTHELIRRVLALVCAAGLLGASALAAPAAMPPPPALRAGLKDFDRMGTVHLFSSGAASSVAIMVSGDGGWDDPLMQRMTQQLVATGVAVIGIDTGAYLNRVETGANQCADPASDFENLAHAMEKQLGMARYVPPVLIGYSSGAALVYAALTQAPHGTFQAGISVGLCTELDLRTPLCSARDAISEFIGKEAGTQHLLPHRQLATPWRVLQGAQDHYCTVAGVRDFINQVGGAELYVLPAVDHFFGKPAAWREVFLKTYQSVQTAPLAPRLPPAVSDLPVTEIPSRHGGDELAILYTGDGGWAELDQALAADLANAGVSVVALSSLQYFWRERTPLQAAHDLSRLMAHYSLTWQRPRIRLLGYSFGADVLPAIINALPEADRSRIVSVGLLAPLPRTSFEIRVAGWLGRVVGEQAVRPELDRLAAAHIAVTCVYGRDDDESLCRELPATTAHVVALPGGHSCNDDHVAIVQAWLNPVVASAVPVGIRE